MKITEDLREYAAEQGIAEEEAFKKGMEAMKEFVEKGRGGLREGITSGARRSRHFIVRCAVAFGTGVVVCSN